MTAASWQLLLLIETRRSCLAAATAACSLQLAGCQPARQPAPACLLLTPPCPLPLPPGTIRKGQQVSICSSLDPAGKCRVGKVNELFVYDNFNRVPVEEVQAGDICALTGISDIMVGLVAGCVCELLSVCVYSARALGVGLLEVQVTPACSYSMFGDRNCLKSAGVSRSGQLGLERSHSLTAALGPRKFAPTLHTHPLLIPPAHTPHTPLTLPQPPTPPRSVRPSAARTPPTRCRPSRWRSPPCP